MDRYGAPYQRYIYVNPFCCNCKEFWDVSYCHHILAVNRLGIAHIVLDPNYVPPPLRRRLAIRNLKKTNGRPKNIGSALSTHLFKFNSLRDN